MSLLEKYDYSWPRHLGKEHKMLKATNEPISMGKAIELFDDMSSIFKNIFKYVEDACHLRAHLISGYLFDKGIISDKAWVMGTEEAPIRFKLGRRCKSWEFHVASAVKVETFNDDNPIAVIMDPAMFDGPVTIASLVSTLNVTENHIKIREGLFNGKGGVYAPRCPLDTIDSKALKDVVKSDFQVLCKRADKCKTIVIKKSKLREDFEKAVNGNNGSEVKNCANINKPKAMSLTGGGV